MFCNMKSGEWVVLVCAQRVPRLVKIHAALDETITVLAATFGNGRPVYEDFERATGLGESAFGRGMRRIVPCNPDDNEHAFALALAVLTWLHGSQAPDARAELDAWMQAGIDGGNGDTMADASGLQYVKTWAVLIDDPKAKP